jgi:hypothetical protein
LTLKTKQKITLAKMALRAVSVLRTIGGLDMIGMFQRGGLK